MWEEEVVVVAGMAGAGDGFCGAVAGLATLDVDVDLDLNREFPRNFEPALGGAIVLCVWLIDVLPIRTTDVSCDVLTCAMPFGHLGITQGGLSITPVAFTVSTCLCPIMFCDSKSRSQR